MYSDLYDPPRGAKSRPGKAPPQKRKAAIREPSPEPSAGAPMVNGKGKQPRVSFSEAVMVKDIPSANRGMTVAEMNAMAAKQAALRKGLAVDDDDDAEGEDDDGMAWASELLDGSSEDDLSGSDASGSGSGSDEDEEMMDAEVGDGVGIMSRMDRELFDDAFNAPSEDEFSEDDEEDADDGSEDEDQDDAPGTSEAKLSRHARRLRALSKQIAELEAQSVAKKDWTMKGEASARDRPQNSLLEQDLDFEHIAKIVPAVTEEKSMGLEDLIKRRILEVSRRSF